MQRNGWDWADGETRYNISIISTPLTDIPVLILLMRCTAVPAHRHIHGFNDSTSTASVRRNAGEIKKELTHGIFNWNIRNGTLNMNTCMHSHLSWLPGLETDGGDAYHVRKIHIRMLAYFSVLLLGIQVADHPMFDLRAANKKQVERCFVFKKLMRGWVDNDSIDTGYSSGHSTFVRLFVCIE